ncbi:MAG: flagellar basal body-associated FliL family protein [Nitrospinales bacterium]
MTVIVDPNKKKKPLYLQEIEARELGHLIEEDKLADIEEDKLGNRIRNAFKNINSNEKIVGICILLLIIILPIVVWLTFFNDVNEPMDNQVKRGNGFVGKGKASGITPIVFKLDSFFMPLLKGGKEIGPFLTVEIELKLSNKIVLREVEQALPLIRQNIFSILKRTKAKDFIERKIQIEKRIKKEIIATTNTTLISGVGSVEDVHFSQFYIN